ncbi:MAG: CPBP family intramembrane metalloprotease [Clostridium argentinense]|uniref:CPBP family intramembrane metalloprotease n=1 Tax=Clostridium faecium TaxID=2762223 RepID=A0ABR8YUQ2_9CLOT|nr:MULTISPECIES: CPBP family intramembrane glutamic endopeptidase [Clostridium]MBD8047955.1 CPBP family intramembrane metalloprotease [Clostridium faecium]MBS5825003.1 CPBP family intramembrane metalloprotease [Clostridium argentinense]MDU1350920.1 CPBP family intramembrane glutamic endopeptidase [Clostridium argentinense]
MEDHLRLISNIVLYLFIYLLGQFLSVVLVTIPSIFYYAHLNINLNEVLIRIDKNILITVSIGAMFSLVIYALILKKSKNNLWKICNFGNITMKSITFIGIISICYSIISTCFVGFSYKLFPVYNTIVNSPSYNGNIVSLISGIIFIPIFEEILFRGIIFNELRDNLSLITSILIQGIIFAIMHGNIIQVIYTFPLAIMLALVYIWTNSIWASILLHIFFNFIGMVITPNIVSLNILAGALIPAITLLAIVFKDFKKIII